jgi:heme-degrading monooxygenase HmoA
MKEQAGFVSTQLHRGTTGSTTFVNVAVWESARALGRAFSSPKFQARSAGYPESTIAAPHVFTKVAVSGICDGQARTNCADGSIGRVLVRFAGWVLVGW